MSENTKYPETHLDAKSMVESALNSNMRLLQRTYDAIFAQVSTITHFFIEEVEDEMGSSTLDLTITYLEGVLKEGHEFKEVEKTRKLKVLSAKGDSEWTYRLIQRVWEDNYPTTVAIDMETKELFFFNIKMSAIELVAFSVLDDQQFEAFKFELNDHEPFKVRLAEKAMMTFIDGAEGINYLKRNIIVQLNCGIPLEIGLKTQVDYI